MLQPKRKKYFIITGVVVFLSLGLLAFEGTDFKLIKNIDIFVTLFKELNTFYVDDIDADKLMKTAIDKMLESLDPYTNYITESEADDFQFMTTGKYGGVGAIIRTNGDNTIVEELYKGFPADKAGIKSGDILLEIDGVSTAKKDIKEISEMLKGVPGTNVSVKIRRPIKNIEFTKTFTRERISISSIPYYGMLNGTIGYVHLTNFTEGSGEAVRKAFEDLKNNQHAQAYILDLRGNTGGLLDEAVKVLNIFLPMGVDVVNTKGKITIQNTTYTTSIAPLDTVSPLVVMVNRGSASASEIVAGAIQDLDRGVIVGTRTYGKGLVQITRPLSYNTQLKVTTSKYYIPSGRCIQAVDYSHRNADGSVGYVPDSLIHEFKTKHGRKVYDGGGIIPDVVETPDTPSYFAVSLYAKNYIFDYVTQYYYTHDSVPFETKKLADKDYQDFIAFLKDKDFEYKTESDESMQKLIKAAKREKYYDQAKQEIEALEKKIKHDKNKDLITFRNEIEKYIIQELITRYYYQDGYIKYALQTDKESLAVIALLKDNARYKGILDGSIVEKSPVVMKKGESDEE